MGMNRSMYNKFYQINLIRIQLEKRKKEKNSILRSEQLLIKKFPFYDYFGITRCMHYELKVK